jgi:hypothetical protein
VAALGTGHLPGPGRPRGRPWPYSRPPS